MQRQPGASRSRDRGYPRGFRDRTARIGAGVVFRIGLRRCGEVRGASRCIGRDSAGRSGSGAGGRYPRRCFPWCAGHCHLRCSDLRGSRSGGGFCADAGFCAGRVGDDVACPRHDRTCGAGRAQGRAESRAEAGEEPPESLGRGQLRRGNVRERREEENLVTTGGRPALRGVGLGLRWEFLDELVTREASGIRAEVDFLEIAPENYLKRGGKYREGLHALAARHPILTHGLTLSLGGPDPLDAEYLRDLKGFLDAIESPWHSDHLCVGAVDGRAVHDLLPVSHKASAIRRIADRIRDAQDRLGLPLAVENISYYWHPGRAEMGEAEFLARVCEAADCGLLLDVNNAYVNAVNFGADVDAWMRAAPLDRVVQIHVAGHEWFHASEAGLGEPCAPGTTGAIIVDTHGAEAPDPVLALLERVLPRTGPVPVVLERDQNIPPLDDLLVEVARVRALWTRVFGAGAGGAQSDRIVR